MKIIYNEKICVKCLACLSEAEFGGVTYERGRIFFDENRAEDWENIISICPVGAIKKIPPTGEIIKSICWIRGQS